MSQPEHFDMVIVGAGLSGIGAAYHLQDKCPDKSYVILEGREDLGGTWDLFRYPGIRSDSDMHTLGYNFKPWRARKAIADGPSIMSYMRETAAENEIEPHIRFRHLVTKANWSSKDANWSVETTNKATGETTHFTCNFLFMCSGYYSYREGHTPDFAGRDDFKGEIIHPQFWPEDLDYKDKRVVVIGSGATAMTLIPSMAGEAAHITMLQRSPTYVVSRPDKDTIANTMRKVLPENWAYGLTRWKNVTLQNFFYNRTRTKPDKVKRALLKRVRKGLGPDYDVATDFTPNYNPWDQRVCLIPNGDLFKAISTGQASVATDEIDLFTETGIRLKSGETLEADIIITATGLELVVLGETKFSIDGTPVDFSKSWTYKGFMYSGVPNMASVFGYINASWTLRSDLISEYVCRLINHMNETGMRQCVPTLRTSDEDMPERSWIDGFSSGYMKRVMHLFPKQGDREPWINPQNYMRDKKMFRSGELEDGAMVFSQGGIVPEEKPELAAAE